MVAWPATPMAADALPVPAAAPAGGAIAAVRAAGRSGSLQRAVASAEAARGGPPGNDTAGADRAAGNSPTVVPTGGTLLASLAMTPSDGSFGAASGRGAGAAGDAYASAGRGGPPHAPGSGAGGPSGSGGAVVGAGAGEGGGDVSGLPLEQQVAHYAREAAAAAGAGDSVRSAMAVHLLNGCFLRAPSYESCQELAAAAAAAAPRLAAVLVEGAAEGGPASLLALNAMTFLALCPQVIPSLLSAGLVAVLLGQLRAAASAPLEQQLLASGLGLLRGLVAVSAAARDRLAGMRGGAAALAGALGHQAGAVRAPALALLQELVLTRKGLQQVTSCAALLAALDRLCGEEEGAPPGGPGAGPEALCSPQRRSGCAQQPVASQAAGRLTAEARQARSLRATIAALAVVMK